MVQFEINYLYYKVLDFKTNSNQTIFLNADFPREKTIS